MTMRFLLSLSLLALAAAGCATTGASGGAAGPIVGPTWTLVALGADAPARSDAQIVFGGDGRVSGSTGCNRFFGTYTLGVGDALAVSDVGTTRQACPGPLMAQEARVLDALSRADRVVMEGERLSLAQGGTRLLSFADTGMAPVSPEPGAAGALDGRTWRLAEIREASGVVLSYDGEAPFTLGFGADGRYNGQADCNRYGGSFEAGLGGALRLSQGLSTLAACPGESASGAFFGVLNGVQEFSLSGSRLVLSAADGGALVFE